MGVGLFKTFKGVYSVFSFNIKMGYWLSLFLLFLSSITELLGLAAMLPIFSVMLSNDFITSNETANYIFTTLNFKTKFGFVTFLCALLVGLIVVKNIFSVFVQRFHAKFSFSLYTYFCTGLYMYFNLLPYSEYKKYNSSSLVNFINNHPSFFAQYFVLPMLTLINEIIVVSLILITVTLYDPQVVLLLFIVVFPLSLIAFRLIRKRIDGFGIEKNTLGILIQKTSHQSVEGYIDIKVLLKDNYFFNKFKSLVEKNAETSIKSSTWLSIPSKVIEIGMILGIVSLILVGVFLDRDKAQLSALLGVFAIAAYRVLPSVNRIMASMLMMREHRYTGEIILNVKNKTEEFKSLKDCKPLKDFNSEIKIDNISFNYPQRGNILSDISFSIRKGEKVGIIGKSGSGKTTLMNIILRFLEESQGKIEIDGMRIDNSNLQSWRSMLGYVQQNVYILEGSVAENVAFGCTADELNKSKVFDSLEAASLLNIIEKMPAGIDTLISERGGSLSGGQRQRLGIARALYSGAKILLFDEATSALDDETERAITDSIQELSGKNITIIIIAHRHSTLRYCDKIVELENGKVSKILTYQELNRRN